MYSTLHTKTAPPVQPPPMFDRFVLTFTEERELQLLLAVIAVQSGSDVQHKLQSTESYVKTSSIELSEFMGKLYDLLERFR